MSNRYTSKHLWFKSSKSGLIFFIVLMTICLVAFLKQSWAYDRFVAEGRQSRLVHVFFSHIVKYLSNFQLKYHRSFVRTWNSILWMQDSFLPPASQKAYLSILSWYDQRVTYNLNSYKIWPHVHLVQTIQPIPFYTSTSVTLFIAGKIQIKLPQKFKSTVQRIGEASKQFSCWQKDFWYFISHCFDVCNSYFISY